MKLSMEERPMELSGSVLDSILGLQVAVAAAGGRWDDGTGLNWWRSRLADDIGGVDFLGRLTPAAAGWAVVDLVRRAAKSHDKRQRSAVAGSSGRLRTIFWLGGEMEELLARRLHQHKAEAVEAQSVLGPEVQIGESFDRRAFERWLEGLCGEEEAAIVAGGRELKHLPQDDPFLMAKRLAAALLPLPDSYPMPFFRVSRG